MTDSDFTADKPTPPVFTPKASPPEKPEPTAKTVPSSKAPAKPKASKAEKTPENPTAAELKAELVEGGHCPVCAKKVYRGDVEAR